MRIYVVTLAVLMTFSFNVCAEDGDLSDKMKKMINETRLPPIEKRTVIGTWYNNDHSCNRSFERVGEKYYSVTRCKDGSGGDEGTPLERIKPTTFRPRPSRKWGDYYVIKKNGDLSIRDKDGEVDVLPKKTNLWPDKETLSIHDSSLARHNTQAQRITPIEAEAIINDKLKNETAVIEEMVHLIKGKGYRCDSISSAMPMILARGFKLTCNRYDYKYEIEDKGGKWSVTLK